MRLTMIQTNDLCEKCGLYKPSLLICCNTVMERNVQGLSISWVCNNCGFNMATTGKRFCIISNTTFNRDMFSKIDICPYSKT